MTKGNVLFITIDQLRAEVLDGALYGLVPTPAIDRLRREGVTFARHFTVTVPCGPSRASLLTGLYPFNHRSIRNGTPLDRRHATVATQARKAGYEPLLFGYTDTTPDPTTHHPADPDLLSYEGVAPGFREIVEMRMEAGVEWPAYLLAKGYRFTGAMDGSVPDLYRPVVEGRAPRLGDPALYRAEDSDTAYLTDRFLQSMAPRIGRPWFAHLTYIRPHPPLVAPAPYNTLVDPAAVPRARTGCPAHPFIDAWFSTPTQASLFHGFDGDCANMTTETVAQARAIYLGLVAEVDHHLGRILDWLDQTDQAESTLVILTADHGEMLGDKHMWGKQSVFEPAFRVPLVIRDPRTPPASAGRIVDAITESIDLAPTILERIGAPVPPAMDGVPLTAWLDRTTPEAWRDAAFAELDLAEPDAPTRFQTFLGLPEHGCNAAIVREARWKLVHFNGSLPPLLFDLGTDPDEENDLAADPSSASVIARLRGRLLDRRLERADRRLTGFAVGA